MKRRALLAWLPIARALIDTRERICRQVKAIEGSRLQIYGSTSLQLDFWYLSGFDLTLSSVCLQWIMRSCGSTLGAYERCNPNNSFARRCGRS